jgi:hypothetical protein
MSVTEIEAAIEKLPKSEFQSLISWLDDFRERTWDEQIEADAEAGKLDEIIAQAKRDSEAGLGTPL